MLKSSTPSTLLLKASQETINNTPEFTQYISSNEGLAKQITINKTEFIKSFNSLKLPSLGSLDTEKSTIKKVDEVYSITNKYRMSRLKHESTCSAHDSNDHSPQLSP